MSLDQQIKILVDSAPQDGTTPEALQALAPALTEIAAQLQHLEFYVWRSLDDAWVLTTLSNRQQPDLEKRVIYAFATPADATNFQQSPDPEIIAAPVPVTHILFQMLAMDVVDSTIFFTVPGNPASATEVSRQQLQERVQIYLQQYVIDSQRRQNIPPNFA